MRACFKSQPVFIFSLSSKIVRKAGEASRPNNSLGVWLQQERSRPQATEGHCQGLAGHRPSWASQEESGGLCGRSQAPEGQREFREPCPNFLHVLYLLCLKGEGQARLANVGSSCQNHKRPISSIKSVSRGCACLKQEPESSSCPGGLQSNWAQHPSPPRSLSLAAAFLDINNKWFYSPWR